MKLIVASTASPEISTGCRKPWRPSVRSGVSSAGSAASTSPASRVALIRMSLALPGCTSTPLMRTTTSEPVNDSACISPRSEPSSV